MSSAISMTPSLSTAAPAVRPGAPAATPPVDVVRVEVTWPRNGGRYSDVTGDDQHVLSTGNDRSWDQSSSSFEDGLGPNLWPLRIAMAPLTIVGYIGAMAGAEGGAIEAIVRTDQWLAGERGGQLFGTSDAERAISAKVLDSVRGSGLLQLEPHRRNVELGLQGGVRDQAIIRVGHPDANGGKGLDWDMYAYANVATAPPAAQQVFAAAANAEQALKHSGLPRVKPVED